jgi:hypothetical protein
MNASAMVSSQLCAEAHISSGKGKHAQAKRDVNDVEHCNLQGSRWRCQLGDKVSMGKLQARHKEEIKNRQMRNG